MNTTTTVKVNLTPDQIEHIWLLLAQEKRELQDTVETDANHDGIDRTHVLNNGITKELRTAWYNLQG